MPDVAVIFGGPSPEHDVSVLTGLQAARALARHRSTAGVRALYWSKTGEWFEVDPALEAERLPRRACPRGPTPAAAVGRARRRLRRARRPSGPGPAARPRRRRGLLPRGPGRGRHPAGRPRPGRHRLHRPDRGRGRARHGQAGLRRGGGRRRAAHAAPPPAHARPGAAGFAGPYIVQAPLRWLLDRHRRGRGPGHRPGPPGGQPPPAAGGGARALPARPRRPAGGRAHLARAPALGHRAPHADRRHRRHPRLPRQVRGRRGHGRRPPRAAGPHPDRRSRRGSGRPPAPWPLLAGVRGVARIDFLADGDAVRGQRGQHHPRLAGPLPLDRPAGALRQPCWPTWWTRPASGPPTPTGARGPTARSSGRPARSPPSWAEPLAVPRRRLLPR